MAFVCPYSPGSMGFFYSCCVDEKMNPTTPKCSLYPGLSPEEKALLANWPIDARTNQAFRNLRVHAEELALELVVRLRVLGKSLANGCEAVPGKKNTYQRLRCQLESFLGSLVEKGLADQHYFPIIRNYLQGCLPIELRDCAGEAPCRIELVEAAIFLLSMDIHENGDPADDPAPLLCSDF